MKNMAIALLKSLSVVFVLTLTIQAQDADNIIKNGDFEADTDWIVEVVGTASATVEIVGGELSFTDVNGEGNSWEVQMHQVFDQQQLDSLYEGYYELTFDARTSADSKDIHVYLGEIGGGWSRWWQAPGDGVVNIDGEMKTYKLGVNVTPEMLWPDMRLGFEVNYDTSSVWIDNVVLKRTEAPPAVDVDITFLVDLSVQELTGVFNPDEHLVRVVGEFNGWDVGSGFGMASIGNSQYTVTFPVDSAFSNGEFAYKYVLDFNNGDIQWDEPGLDDNISDDRFVSTAGATDIDEDGDLDISTGLEYFGSISSIDQVRHLPDNLQVIVEATATTPSMESASRTLFYVQNEGSGIAIFKFGTPVRLIDVGNVLRIRGTTATFNGLKEIVVDDVEVDIFMIEEFGEAPEPRVISFEEFVEASFIETDTADVQGSLVRINSLTTDPSTWPTDIDATSANVEGEDSEGNIFPIRLLAQTGAMGVFPPENFDIIGVAGTFNGTQIIPRFDSDIFGVAAPVPFPEPPYTVGDTINYNGNFANYDLGPIGGYVDGWFFDNENGISTYEISDDSQDGDGRSVKANIDFDDGPDIWRAQIVNEVFNVESGDLIKASFWMKGSVDGMVTEAFFGLPAEGDFQDVSLGFFELSMEWQQFEIEYYTNDFDAEVGMRFGVKLNFPENDLQMAYLDNAIITKEEIIITEVNFSVNTAVQQELMNFDKEIHSVGVVGSFNRWDTDNPVILEAEFGDTTYSGIAELMNATLGDTVRYKFILKDEETGFFEWESPDPTLAMNVGEFSDRVIEVTDLASINVPNVYYNDIDRSDLNIDNYAAIPIIDARNAFYGSHLAIQGIVTRVTYNFVYLQDETAGTMLFSRDFFGDGNAIAFNNAIVNGEINVGDELKVAGVAVDFFGLHELVRMHAWEVVSSGNALPAPQFVDINEYSTNGEDYESELVKLEYVRILDPVDSLFGGFIYEITNEDESQIGWMSIQRNNSEWADQPAPQGFFSLTGVVKEFFIRVLDENIYAVAVHNFGDIEEIGPEFDAEFVLDSFPALINTTEGMPIRLVDLGEEPIQGMEFTINYDPNVMVLSIDDQTNTAVESINLVTNEVSPGQILVAFATDGNPENDITDLGTFFNMTLDLIGAGETEVLITDIQINEKPVQDFGAIVNIVPRLCGDVSGDNLVTALDASFVLQNTVKIADVFPLVGLDSTAADVTGNGDISAFDASWILQKTVGVRDNLGCISLPLKEEPDQPVADLRLIDSNDGIDMVELDFAGSNFDVYAIQLELTADNGLSFKGIQNLPEEWNMLTNTTDGVIHISLYGIQPIQKKSLILELASTINGALPTIKAQVTLNETEAPDIDELVIGEAPSEFALNQNYPNPFNPSTNISYTLPEMSQVDITIYNMLGQRVATLVNQTQEAGSYTINWEAGSASSGVYIYRLTAGNQTFTKRMMLIK